MAAMRSSPGLPEDGDFPSSPPMLPQPIHVHRKRQLHPDDDLSSDPVFSEDMSESDEHPNQRRKRVVRGPWYLHQHTERPANGRKLTKFVDSGVWLASESSDDSLFNLDPPDIQHDMDTRMLDVAIPTLPRPQDIAAQIVNECIENNKERVDLSGCSLSELPADVLRPLNQLIRAIEHPDSDTYAPLSPDLQIFLGSNGLQDLPYSLWDLENLTVLSLRSNQIKELSHSVGRLKKLKELNIASNDLRWLPWELLQMLRSRPGQALMLSPQPNPLWEPKEGLKLPKDASILAYQEFASALGVSATAQSTTPPLFCGASRKRYYAVDGSLLRESQDLPSAWADAPWEVEPEDDVSGPGHMSGAQSLYETAAKMVRQHLSSVPVTTIEPIIRAVDRCRELHNQYEPQCSVCGRGCLFKRAEWVEYWYCNVSGPNKPASFYVLPFMRMACTFGCAAQAAQGRHCTAE